MQRLAQQYFEYSNEPAPPTAHPRGASWRKGLRVVSVLRRGEPGGTCVPHRSPRACSGRCCARNGRGALRARPATCGMRHAQQNPHQAALHGNTRRVNMPCGIQRTAWNAQCARRRPASPPYRPHRPDRQTRAAPVAWLRSKGDAVGSATQCSRQSRSSVEGSRRNSTRGTSGYSQHRVPMGLCAPLALPRGS